MRAPPPRRARPLAAALLGALLAAPFAAAPASADAAGPARPEPVKQVYLIQDSGWMEPFLTAEGSQFRPLVEALAAATHASGGAVAVAAFDQDGQVPGRTSPRVLYDGPYDGPRVRAAIDAIDLPRKGGGQAFADADFGGALLGAVRAGLDGRAGVIWMVTNNRNAPGNSPEVERNTAAFTRALRGSDAIPRIVAYPVRMPLKGRNFSEGGFVVYGIGYGAAGGRALDAALTLPALKALFRDPPVSLKPVLAGGLGLRFDRFDGGGLSAGMEGDVLVVRGADAAAGATLQLTGRLHNGLYPQRVAAARLALAWSEVGAGEAGAAETARASVSPDRVTNLAPRADSGPLAVTLALPPVPRPPGLSGLLAGRRDVDGTLTLRLADLRLDLDPAFLERVRPIFGGGLLAGDRAGGSGGVEDRLPELFRDYRGVSQAALSLPVRIEAEFSPWPLVGASAGALALAGAAGAGAAAAGRARTQTVMLGAHAKRVTLRPYRAQVVRAPDGGRWRVRTGLWGRASATPLAEPPAGPGPVA